MAFIPFVRYRYFAEGEQGQPGSPCFCTEVFRPAPPERKPSPHLRLMGKEKKIDSSFKVLPGKSRGKRLPLCPIKPYLSLHPASHFYIKSPPKHNGLPFLYKAGRRKAIKIGRLNWPFERLHLFTEGLSFKTLHRIEGPWLVRTGSQRPGTF